VSDEPVKPKRGLRGFAAMTPERRREVAALGGKAVPGDKRTFTTNRVLARVAGKRGGNRANRKQTQED
jgi:general stress protein YciG